MLLAFILRRLGQARIVMLAVGLVAFSLFQYVGDPALSLLGQDATRAEIARVRAELGLDQPFFVQFWHFAANALQGEFGISLRQGTRVSTLFVERLPATLELVLVAAVLALAVGIPLGVFAALNRGSFESPLAMAGSQVA